MDVSVPLPKVVDHSGIKHFAVLLLMGVALTGCGAKAPFDLVPVEGQVIYSDGSPVQADSLLVTFHPQGVENRGKDAPRAAQGQVNMSDGTFSKFTTWKYGDGVMVGNHKVTVVSMKSGAHGMVEPSRDVPLRYHRVDSTPLSVEVKAGGDNQFTLKIDRQAD